MAEYTSDDERREGASQVNLLDVFFQTLRHWPWILLSVAVCVGLACLYILRTPPTYTRSAAVMIKEDSNGKSGGSAMADFADFGLFQNGANVYNEMTTFQSKDLMDEVVHRLNLDISYYDKGLLRNTVVYGDSLPVTVALPGFPEEGTLSMNVAVSPKGEVTLSDLKVDDESAVGSFRGAMGKAIKTPAGDVLVMAGPAYAKGTAVDLFVAKSPVSDTRKSLSKRLGVKMVEQKGTVLELSIPDQSQKRADDILETLIKVYNESWVRDKNQVAVATSNFINDRLGVIEAELGNVDTDISSYKSANLVPDVQAASSMYMTQSQQTSNEILGLSTQLQMARYIHDYIGKEGAQGQLLPANAGIENPTLETQILAYNEKLLERNAIAQKSSDKNPIVQNLDTQLAAQRQAITGTVDNEIRDLQTRVRELQRSEARTLSRISSNPTQADRKSVV